MDASPPWDRMVLMGRIQHSIHLSRSCMGSKTRTLAQTEQAAPLALWPAQERWGFTTTRFSGLTSMMGMVESDEDSGPPSVAEREPGTQYVSYLMPPMTPCCSSLSLIIHVHYRHLLTLIHVNDCFTTSLTFGSFAPLIRATPSVTHGLFVSTYAYLLDFDAWPKRSPVTHYSPLFPPCPLISIFPRSFGTTSYLLHSSHSSFVALFSPSRNCTVLYLIHARWHTRLSTTIY